jgi:hypothetical protein
MIRRKQGWFDQALLDEMLADRGGVLGPMAVELVLDYGGAAVGGLANRAMVHVDRRLCVIDDGRTARFTREGVTALFWHLEYERRVRIAARGRR